MECWSAGVLEGWRAEGLECWRAGLLEYWRVGVLEGWLLEGWLLEGWSSCRLRRVLGFSISEGPIFLGDFHQVDKCILAPQAKALFQTIRHGLVKKFFLFHGSPAVEGDL